MEETLTKVVGGYDRLYYLISGRQLVSWEEGEMLCQSLGGHLPSITSPRDTELLERFLLGPAMDDQYTDYVPQADCRYYDPLCMVYIGLYTDKVINYL